MKEKIRSISTLKWKMVLFIYRNGQKGGDGLQLDRMGHTATKTAMEHCIQTTSKTANQLM